ncbi:MAG: serine protease [Candidatus Obscuribacterales bacterium]|nr:serine protease [Candidatus Obscuribacterales bacterium]
MTEIGISTPNTDTRQLDRLAGDDHSATGQTSESGKFFKDAYSHLPESAVKAAQTVATLGVLGASLYFERARALPAIMKEAEIIGQKLLLPAIQEFAGHTRLGVEVERVIGDNLAVGKEFQDETESVVMVNTLLPHGKGLARGSGTIVREDGVVATNYHVVKGSGIMPLVTTSSGEVFTSELIARDKVSDIALLRIVDSHPAPFHPVKFAPKGAGVKDVAVLEYSGQDKGMKEFGPGHVLNAWLSSSERGHTLSLHPDRTILSPGQLAADKSSSARRADFIEVCTDLDCEPGTSGAGIFSPAGQIGIVRGGGTTRSMGKITLGTHIDHLKAMLNALPKQLPANSWFDMLTRAEVGNGQVSVNVIKMTEIPWDKTVRFGSSSHVVPDNLEQISAGLSDEVRKHISTGMH